MTKLFAEDLAKRFGPRLLFRRLNLEVAGGQAIAVTGANGSGKSTFLRILAGVMTPNKGQVTLQRDGVVVPPEKLPLCVGYVAPYLNVYEGFSARENLEFIARARRLTGAGPRIAELIDLVGLSRRGDDLVKTFSSGMKQRVKFAAALLPDPDLLLLDEPTTNLDDAGVAMVRSVIERHLGNQGIVVLATNNAQERAWCETAVCIEDFKQ